MPTMPRYFLERPSVSLKSHTELTRAQRFFLLPQKHPTSELGRPGLPTNGRVTFPFDGPDAVAVDYRDLSLRLEGFKWTDAGDLPIGEKSYGKML
jgi:hypothetical protein